jgi:hypothetical protein
MVCVGQLEWRGRNCGGRSQTRSRARHLGANVELEDSRRGTRGQLVGGAVEGQVIHSQAYRNFAIVQVVPTAQLLSDPVGAEVKARARAIKLTTAATVHKKAQAPARISIVAGGKDAIRTTTKAPRPARAPNTTRSAQKEDRYAIETAIKIANARKRVSIL